MKRVESSAKDLAEETFLTEIGVALKKCQSTARMLWEPWGLVSRHTAALRQVAQAARLMKRSSSKSLLTLVQWKAFVEILVHSIQQTSNVDDCNQMRSSLKGLLDRVAQFRPKAVPRKLLCHNAAEVSAADMILSVLSSRPFRRLSLLIAAEPDESDRCLLLDLFKAFYSEYSTFTLLRGCLKNFDIGDSNVVSLAHTSHLLMEATEVDASFFAFADEAEPLTLPKLDEETVEEATQFTKNVLNGITLYDALPAIFMKRNHRRCKIPTDIKLRVLNEAEIFSECCLQDDEDVQVTSDTNSKDDIAAGLNINRSTIDKLCNIFAKLENCQEITKEEDDLMNDLCAIIRNFTPLYDEPPIPTAPPDSLDDDSVSTAAASDEDPLKDDSLEDYPLELVRSPVPRRKPRRRYDINAPLSLRLGADAFRPWRVVEGGNTSDSEGVGNVSESEISQKVSMRTINSLDNRRERTAKFDSGVNGVVYREGKRAEWVASYRHKGHLCQKCFGVARYGFEEALRLAIEHRQEAERNGIANLHRIAQHRSNVKYVYYNSVYEVWQSHPKGHLSKTFSCKVHGLDEAKRMAEEYASKFNE